jgi:hypothetical protein
MRHNDNDRHTTALTLGMCHEKLVTSSPYDQVLVGVALIVFVIVLWSVVVVSDYYSEVIPGSVYPDTQTHALLRFIPDIITRYSNPLFQVIAPTDWAVKGLPQRAVASRFYTVDLLLSLRRNADESARDKLRAACPELVMSCDSRRIRKHVEFW